MTTSELNALKAIVDNPAMRVCWKGWGEQLVRVESIEDGIIYCEDGEMFKANRNIVKYSDFFLLTTLPPVINVA